MTQQAKEFATKPDHLSSIPGTQTVERGYWLLQIVLRCHSGTVAHPLCALAHTCACSQRKNSQTLMSHLKAWMGRELMVPTHWVTNNVATVHPDWNSTKLEISHASRTSESIVGHVGLCHPSGQWLLHLSSKSKEDSSKFGSAVHSIDILASGNDTAGKGLTKYLVSCKVSAKYLISYKVSTKYLVSYKASTKYLVSYNVLTKYLVNYKVLTKYLVSYKVLTTYLVSYKVLTKYLINYILF